MAWNPQVGAKGVSAKQIGVVTGLIVRDVTSTTLATVIEGGWINIAVDPTSSTNLGKDFLEYRLADTAKTFTASKDTYCIVNAAGTIVYEEVTNGAAKPTQQAIEDEHGYGSQIFALVVSDADEITAVYDYRQLAGVEMLESSFTVSFATAEQGAGYWIAPTRCRIWKAQASVQVALANTDAGTITFAQGVNDIYTNMTNGVITLALSSAIGTRASCLPSAYFTLEAGQSLRYTSAKTTAGGRTITQILYSRV